MSVTYADIEAARIRLDGIATPTALITCSTLDQMTGAHILIKPENLQKTGSFKIRGAFNRISAMTEADYQAWSEGFRLLPSETLAGVLADYQDVAKHTDELVATLPDLDVDHPLPPAPWTPPGERWSARRTLLHIAGETFQHAGHADIIRESLDGAKSMS